MAPTSLRSRSSAWGVFSTSKVKGAMTVFLAISPTSGMSRGGSVRDTGKKTTTAHATPMARSRRKRALCKKEANGRKRRIHRKKILIANARGPLKSAGNVKYLARLDEVGGAGIFRVGRMFHVSVVFIVDNGPVGAIEHGPLDGASVNKIIRSNA